MTILTELRDGSSDESIANRLLARHLAENRSIAEESIAAARQRFGQLRLI